MKIKVMLLLATLLAPLSQAWAWGNDGHKTIGAIADRLIAGSRAEAEVKSLLQSGESLESVAIWADCIKGGCGTPTQEMKDFELSNPRHGSYHFADVPFLAEGYVKGAIGTRDEDVVQILTQAIAVLQGKTDAAANPHGFTKRQALLLVAHMVGDIHQPLHVGVAYVSDKPEWANPKTQAEVDNVHIFGTQGDNLLQLRPEARLHFYWDVLAVADTMKAANVTTPGQWADSILKNKPPYPLDAGTVADWPLQWAQISRNASSAAHVGIEPAPQVQGLDAQGKPAVDRNGKPIMVWPVKMTLDGYEIRGQLITAEFVYRAGYRLAYTLKAIWP